MRLFDALPPTGMYPPLAGAHNGFAHPPGGPQEQEECVKEVEALARLESPYIIKYYDSFVEHVRQQRVDSRPAFPQRADRRRPACLDHTPARAATAPFFPVCETERCN